MTQNWDPETYAEHGRFVGEFGGDGNVASIREALAAVRRAL